MKTTSSSPLPYESLDMELPDRTGRNDQSRVRLYVAGLFLVAVFIHAVSTTIRMSIDGTKIGDALYGADEGAHLLLIAVAATFVALLAWHRFSSTGLAYIDIGMTMLVPATGILATFMHPPVPLPELPSLLFVTLVLAGRAAVVPSTAMRTALVGLLSLTPIAAAAVLCDSHRAAEDGPTQTLALITVFGFGIAAVAVTVVTSRTLYRLRRTVRWATRLGPYLVGNKLGEGGMGTVYEGWHALLKRRTAIKLVGPSLPPARAEERFASEARITSELNHPNTVSVYDYGRTSDGIYYYAMELVDGITLDELVRREGALAPGRVLHLLRQVAASLANAHARGLIHRDIKPSNVMVCNREGQPDLVKVLDFGLAMKVVEDGEIARSIAGTPAYMPPEAGVEPESVGPPSDAYSVAVLGYYMLTGSVPFGGRCARSVMRAHVVEPLLPPSLRVGCEVPRDLEAVLLSCLEKNPGDRPQDGGELLALLERCEPGSDWTKDRARRWWSSFENRAPVRDTVPSGPATTRPSLATRPIPLTVRRALCG